MSLEDKFYPEDGTLLTKIDTSLIKVAGKLGETYQNITGNSYKTLVKKIYSISSKMYFINSYIFPISTKTQSKIAKEKSKSPKFESALEEEIRYETMGLDKNIGKKIRLASVAIINAADLFSAESAYIGFNTDNVSTSTLAILLGISGISRACAETFYFSAEYMSKANIPEPPKKTIYARAKDKLKLMIPKFPELAPIRANYSSKL